MHIHVNEDIENSKAAGSIERLVSIPKYVLGLPDWRARFIRVSVSALQIAFLLKVLQNM